MKAMKGAPKYRTTKDDKERKGKGNRKRSGREWKARGFVLSWSAVLLRDGPSGEKVWKQSGWRRSQGFFLWFLLRCEEVDE